MHHVRDLRLSHLPFLVPEPSAARPQQAPAGGTCHPVPLPLPTVFYPTTSSSSAKPSSYLPHPAVPPHKALFLEDRQARPQTSWGGSAALSLLPPRSRGVQVLCALVTCSALHSQITKGLFAGPRRGQEHRHHAARAAGALVLYLISIKSTPPPRSPAAVKVFHLGDTFFFPLTPPFEVFDSAQIVRGQGLNSSESARMSPGKNRFSSEGAREGVWGWRGEGHAPRGTVQLAAGIRARMGRGTPK